jgi:hypothetical protein
MTSQTLLTSYRKYCWQEDESPQIDSASGLSKKLTALGYASKRTNLGKQFALKTVEELQGFSKDINDLLLQSAIAEEKTLEVTIVTVFRYFFYKLIFNFLEEKYRKCITCVTSSPRPPPLYRYNEK